MLPNWMAFVLLVLLLIGCIVYLYLQWKSTVKKLEQEKQNRKDDRTGRIRAEQKNAQLLAQLQQMTPLSTLPSSSTDAEKIQFDIIGKVDSVFSQKNGTPRQPLFFAPDARGRIQIFKKFQPLYSLEGVEEFSHLWVLFVFHQNTNQGKETISPKVTPPRLFEKSRKPTIGMFATRTPHRYNPIGISCVKITRVDAKNGWIDISGLDLVHGTPVLDIKPYISGYDNLPHEWVRNASWLQNETQSNPWESVPKMKQIRWDDLAKEQLEEVFFSKHEFRWVHLFYSCKEELEKCITQVVSYDTRSFSQKQKQATEQSIQLCQDLCIKFTIIDNEVIQIHALR